MQTPNSSLTHRPFLLSASTRFDKTSVVSFHETVAGLITTVTCSHSYELAVSPFWGSLGRTRGPSVDLVLLEVVLEKIR